MEPIAVELLKEGIELCLLLKSVHSRRTGGFLLEREMHALVASVLLRMPRLDALDPNAKPEPPNGQLGEVEEGIGGGEWNAVAAGFGFLTASVLSKAVLISDSLSLKTQIGTRLALP